jgi:NAD(P)-dependent dehydrogenase (short-subunit alcohol dehydrogenase family)
MSLELFDLTGKVAVVTGSSRGIGKALAWGMADAGAKMVICSRNIEESEAVARHIRDGGQEAFAMRFDAAVRYDCQTLIDETVSRYGGLDIMVCNAGIIYITPAEEVEEEEWDRTMEINLKGYYNCAQLAARQMMIQGGGSIVLVSSSSSISGFPGLLSYSVAKGGVDQMVRSMAVEWGEHNIRVNAINPGYTNNVMTGLQTDSARDEDFLKKHTPLKPRCRTEELVGPVIFLASNASSNVTGVTLRVDGGYCIR